MRTKRPVPHHEVVGSKCGHVQGGRVRKWQISEKAVKIIDVVGLIQFDISL